MPCDPVCKSGTGPSWVDACLTGELATMAGKALGASATLAAHRAGAALGDLHPALPATTVGAVAGSPCAAPDSVYERVMEWAMTMPALLTAWQGALIRGLVSPEAAHHPEARPPSTCRPWGG